MDMQKPKRIAITPATIDRDGISLAQQTAGAADLTITGALASGGAVTLGYPYAIEAYSAGDIAAVIFTVTGTDQWGKAQTDTITGVNAGVVATTKYFKTVTQIAADAAVGTDVEVGAADEIGFVLAIDLYEPDTSIAVDLSGTIDYTVQKCFERLTATPAQTPNWVAGGLATQTADGTTAYTAPTGGVRLKGNSYANDATIAMQVSQARSH